MEFQFWAFAILIQILIRLIVPKPRLGPIRYWALGLVISIYIASSIATFEHSQELNAYRTLNLPRSISNEEVNRAYKDFLRTNHPDKATRTSAQEYVIKKGAFDKLVRENRANYEVFGDLSEESAATILLLHLLHSLFWWVIFGMLHKSAEGSIWPQLAILGLTAWQYQAICYKEPVLYFTWLPYTVREQIDLAKALLPSVLLITSFFDAMVSFEREINKQTKLRQAVQHPQFRVNFEEFLAYLDDSPPTSLLKSYVDDIKKKFQDKHKVTWGGRIAQILFFFGFVASIKFQLFGTRESSDDT